MEVDGEATVEGRWAHRHFTSGQRVEATGWRDRLRSNRIRGRRPPTARPVAPHGRALRHPRRPRNGSVL